MAVLALGLHPSIVNPVLQFLLKRTRYRDTSVALRYGQILQLFGVYVAFWTIIGAGFAQLIRSVHPCDSSELVAVGAAFCLAWVVGFLAFLTPGGLGVREGALAIFLVPLLPVPLPALVAILARLWWTLGELMAIALAAIWMRGLRQSIDEVMGGGLDVG